MNKILSLALIATLITGQMGCAGQVTKVSMPIDHIQFREDYSFTVIQKKGDDIDVDSGSKLTTSQHELMVLNKNGSQKIVDQNILRIDGRDNRRNGTFAMDAAAPAAAICGSIGGVFGFAVAGGVGRVLWALIYGGMGVVGCGLPAAGIGALIPKRDRIEITPIVDVSKDGVSGGANLGFKF